MPEWNVQYWEDESGNSPLKKWLSTLSTEAVKSISREIRRLEEFGNLLRLPHSKPLKQGLFELRDQHYGYRIYYAFDKNKIVILFGGGDKSTQEHDIKLARERLKQFKNEKKKKD